MATALGQDTNIYLLTTYTAPGTPAFANVKTTLDTAGAVPDVVDSITITYSGNQRTVYVFGGDPKVIYGKSTPNESTVTILYDGDNSTHRDLVALDDNDRLYLALVNDDGTDGWIEIWEGRVSKTDPISEFTADGERRFQVKFTHERLVARYIK